jgi:adenine-specific DNA methylase
MPLKNGHMMKCMDSIFGGKRIICTALKKETNDIISEKFEYSKEIKKLERIDDFNIKSAIARQTGSRRVEML